MQKLSTLSFLLCCIPLISYAQTFSGNGGPIPDDGTLVKFAIPVSGLSGNLDTNAFGVERVCLSLTHTWIADLALSIEAPDGTLIPLLSGLGGDQDGYDNTCLSGNALTSIYEGAYPFTGEFRPFGDMGALNNGQPANGVWKLVILDTYPFADAGDLLEWSITFGPNPCKPFPFSSSDLPIVKINTSGQPIVDNPKVPAQLTVIDNGPGQRNYVDQATSAYSGPAGVELHGNSAQGFPKKSLRLETQDEFGEDFEVSLLGLSKTSDYVLTANFSDKTLMRNALAYDLSRRLGLYAPRTRFCEVLVDNTYSGVYLLTEKVKRGKSLVNVSKLTAADTAGTALTGGYILKIDWNSSPGWNSPFSQPNSPNVYTYFQHEYPKWNVLHPAQQEYIRRYVDSFEVTLKGADFQEPVLGWRRFAEEKTFLDFLIINEISKNVDGYRLSTYFNKVRDDKGGKLHMGPVWDFDLAFYNADYCDNFKPEGWAYDINYVCGDAGVPFWWERLRQDTLFAQNLACYWQTLRTTGAMRTDSIYAVIDSMAAVVAEAQARNFQQWPTLGHYVWPNPGPLPASYEGEVNKMKGWLTARLSWLDFAIGNGLPALDANFTANPLSAFTWQFAANAPNASNYQYTWDFGDGSASTTAIANHDFASEGTYHVRLKITTPYGCFSETEQILHIVNTGTADPNGLSMLRIYPNPAHSTMTLHRSEETDEKAVVRLVNALGEVVLEKEWEDGRIDLQLPVQGIPRGVYEVQVNGIGAVKSGRVVLQ